MATETAPAKAKTAVSNLKMGSADDALTLAAELQKFVKDNKLTSNIQGKQFPNVEAWMFAGTLLGLSTMLESIEDKSTAEESRWFATVAVLNVATGAIVGRGFAVCSNKEHTKRSFADYAICSMAQTRAVGKAYRLSLGWLMKAAGYEATPLEEMQEAAPDAGTGAAVVPAVVLATDAQKNELRRLLDSPELAGGKGVAATLAQLHALSGPQAEAALAHFKLALQTVLDAQPPK